MKSPNTQELAQDEREKLHAYLLGYGRLTAAAQATGLHKNTLSRVNDLGYGTPQTIAIIRRKIFLKKNKKQGGKTKKPVLNEHAN